MKRNSVQVNRWVRFSIAAVLVFAYTAHTRAGPVIGESCGLGLPPGAPGFAEAEARREAEVRKNGFLRVCEANLERYEISFSPMSLATKGLAFQPVDLTRTPFAQFESLGGMAEGVNDTKSRLYRGFRMPDGHTLTLFEHDMSADGSRIWRNPKDEPERINGLPARMVVLQAGSGKAFSNLSWLEGRRYFELWIDANVATAPLREHLFALAGALPASVPACPNEPRRAPVVLGPDGMPVDEPPPAVLTVDQMKALFDKSTRPCK
jgi:hypothetical protein